MPVARVDAPEGLTDVRRSRESFEAELSTVPVFRDLAGPQRADLARRATRAREPAGMVFSKEGERGDELVVILDGQVEVRHDGALLGVLGPGDFVGEVALLDDAARRTATVVARTPVVVAYIGRHDFQFLTASVPGLLESVQTTMRARLASNEPPTP
jgi:CRP-like cAMP-binding protein